MANRDDWSPFLWNPWMWMREEPWGEQQQQLGWTPPTSSETSSVEPRMRSHPGSKFWTHQQAGVVKIEKKSTGELVIKAQLPGVARDDIRLELKEDDQELSVLTLTANKKEEHHHTDKHGGTFYRTSDFQIVRTIPLNAKVSSEDIKADLADELLVIEVNLPPQKDKPSSRIDIHSASQQQQLQQQQQQQQQAQGQRKQPGKLQQQRAGKGEAMDTDISGQHTHAQ